MIVQQQRWLRQIILARVGEPQAIDEVFQEVAAQALLQKSPLLDESKTSAWLYRVAVRQCLLYRRKCGRQRRLMRRYGCEQTSHQFNTPDALHWLLNIERQEQVRAAVLQLPAQDAELLLLKYAEGWRYQHMAQKLGLSVSIVLLVANLCCALDVQQVVWLVALENLLGHVFSFLLPLPRHNFLI